MDLAKSEIQDLVAKSNTAQLRELRRGILGEMLQQLDGNIIDIKNMNDWLFNNSKNNEKEQRAMEMENKIYTFLYKDIGPAEAALFRSQSGLSVSGRDRQREMIERLSHAASNLREIIKDYK
jgi:hypothetical protein